MRGTLGGDPTPDDKEPDVIPSVSSSSSSSSDSGSDSSEPPGPEPTANERWLRDEGMVMNARSLICDIHTGVEICTITFATLKQFTIVCKCHAHHNGCAVMMSANTRIDDKWRSCVQWAKAARSSALSIDQHRADARAFKLSYGIQSRR